MVCDMKEIQIRKNDAGQRLDRFVGKAVPLLPESLLQKYIRLKRIKRNGKGAKRDVRLVEGDVLQLYINDEFFEKPTEHNAWLKIATPRLDIVYEDENILLADKKPGVLCHSAGEWSWDTLISNIQAYLRQNGQWDPKAENAFTPALCNRIDRNTGGIVIAAKNAEALRILNDKIRDREIEKSYLCVVCGRPRPAEGRLEGYLFKDAVKNQVYVTKKPQPGAKTAVTEYRTLQSRRGLSLVECRLLTGRTHQTVALHHELPPTSLCHILCGSGAGVYETRSIRTTACAAMPSRAPVKPRPSSVVALTLTRSTSTSMHCARFRRICAMCGASFGAWASTVQSRLPTMYPAACRRAVTARSSARLSAPA